MDNNVIKLQENNGQYSESAESDITTSKSTSKLIKSCMQCVDVLIQHIENVISGSNGLIVVNNSSIVKSDDGNDIDVVEHSLKPDSDDASRYLRSIKKCLLQICLLCVKQNIYVSCDLSFNKIDFYGCLDDSTRSLVVNYLTENTCYLIEHIGFIISMFKQEKDNEESKDIRKSLQRIYKQILLIPLNPNLDEIPEVFQNLDSSQWYSESIQKLGEKLSLFRTTLIKFKKILNKRIVECNYSATDIKNSSTLENIELHSNKRIISDITNQPSPKRMKCNSISSPDHSFCVPDIPPIHKPDVVTIESDTERKKNRKHQTESETNSISITKVVTVVSDTESIKKKHKNKSMNEPVIIENGTDSLKKKKKHKSKSENDSITIASDTESLNKKKKHKNISENDSFTIESDTESLKKKKKHKNKSDNDSITIASDTESLKRKKEHKSKSENDSITIESDTESLKRKRNHKSKSKNESIIIENNTESLKRKKKHKSKSQNDSITIESDTESLKRKKKHNSKSKNEPIIVENNTESLKMKKKHKNKSENDSIIIEIGTESIKKKKKRKSKSENDSITIESDIELLKKKKKRKHELEITEIDTSSDINEVVFVEDTELRKKEKKRKHREQETNLCSEKQNKRKKDKSINVSDCIDLSNSNLYCSKEFSDDVLSVNSNSPDKIHNNSTGTTITLIEEFISNTDLKKSKNIEQKKNKTLEDTYKDLSQDLKKSKNINQTIENIDQDLSQDLKKSKSITQNKHQILEDTDEDSSHDLKKSKHKSKILENNNDDLSQDLKESKNTKQNKSQILEDSDQDLSQNVFNALSTGEFEIEYEDEAENVYQKVVRENQLNENEKFLYIQDLLLEAKENKDISEEIRQKLKNLYVLIDWEIPPAHKVEISLTTTPTPDVQAELKKLGVLSHRYHKDEDRIILRNWNTFCKLHDFDDDPRPFLKLRHGKQCMFRDRRKFIQFLAKDLPYRSLYSIYRRFKVLLSNKKTGRFTPQEDELILIYCNKICGPQYKFSELSNIIDRPRPAIERRYRNLTQEHNERIRWNLELEFDLVKKLQKTIDSKSVEDLKHFKFTAVHFKKVGDAMKLPLDKVRARWLASTYTKLFAKEKLHVDTFLLKMIQILIDSGETDRTKIDWNNLITHFEGFTKHFLWYHFALAENNIIPKRLRKDYCKMIEYFKDHIERQKKAEKPIFSKRTIPRLRLTADGLEPYF